MIHAEDRNPNNKSKNEREDFNMKNGNGHHSCDNFCKNEGSSDCGCNKFSADDHKCDERNANEFAKILSDITGCNVMVAPVSDIGDIFKKMLNIDEPDENEQPSADGMKKDDSDNKAPDFIAKKLQSIDFRLDHIEKMLEVRTRLTPKDVEVQPISEIRTWKPSKKISKKMKRRIRKEVDEGIMVFMTEILGIKSRDDVDILRGLITERRKHDENK